MKGRHSVVSGIALAAMVLLMTPGAPWAAGEAPPIHLVREGWNASQADLIRQQREMCLSQKKMFQDMRRSNPAVWRATEADMKKKRPQYDVDRALAPEPDWARVGIDREEEYFSGNRYALYKKSARYKIADDGSCSLAIEPRERAELDDGTFLYELDLVKRKGTKRASRAAVRAGAEQRGEAAAKGLSAAGFPQAAAALDGALEVSGHDTVAGERCDYAGIRGRAAENCYWSKTHRYPGIMRRPIILKTKVDMGGNTNVKEAVKFEAPAKIDMRVFEPPSGFSLRDMTGRRG